MDTDPTSSERHEELLVLLVNLRFLNVQVDLSFFFLSFEHPLAFPLLLQAFIFLLLFPILPSFDFHSPRLRRLLVKKKMNE